MSAVTDTDGGTQTPLAGGRDRRSGPGLEERREPRPAAGRGEEIRPRPSPRDRRAGNSRHCLTRADAALPPPLAPGMR